MKNTIIGHNQRKYRSYSYSQAALWTFRSQSSSRDRSVSKECVVKGFISLQKLHIILPKARCVTSPLTKRKKKKMHIEASKCRLDGSSSSPPSKCKMPRSQGAWIAQSVEYAQDSWSRGCEFKPQVGSMEIT